MKTIYKPIIYTLLALGIGIFSCGKQEKKKEEVKKDTVTTTKPLPLSTETKPKTKKPTTEEEVKLNLSPEEQNMLLLINQIPLGSSFAKVKETLPNVKEVKTNGKHDKEAKEQLQLLHYKTELSFHFSVDSLYSYYYNIVEPDEKKADRLYKGLQNFYTKNFGEYTTGSLEEEDHYNLSCEWKKDNVFITLKYDVNNSTLIWGYQDSGK